MKVNLSALVTGLTARRRCRNKSKCKMGAIKPNKLIQSISF
jgi:hypothetical protein